MGKKIIKQLRKDNSKLRESNEQMLVEMAQLAHENAMLEQSIEITAESEAILRPHYDQIVVAHDKLTAVEPQYQAKVEELEEAVAVRRQYGDAERRIKTLYAQLLGTLSEMMENHGQGDPELTDEILELVLDCHEQNSTNHEDMIANLPESLEFDKTEEDDYEEITVASEDN